MSELQNDSERIARKVGNPSWVRGGASPNPKGRPRTGMAFAEAVRKHVDPEELIQIALRIARGEPLVRCVDPKTGSVHLKKEGQDLGELQIRDVVYPSNTEVMSALTFLRDSGYFKPPIAMEVNVTSGPSEAQRDYTRLTQAQLDMAIELDEIAAGKPTSTIALNVDVEQRKLIEG